jgi:hypothetical protein
MTLVFVSVNERGRQKETLGTFTFKTKFYTKIYYSLPKSLLNHKNSLSSYFIRLITQHDFYIAFIFQFIGTAMSWKYNI